MAWSDKARAAALAARRAKAKRGHGGRVRGTPVGKSRRRNAADRKMLREDVSSYQKGKTRKGALVRARLHGAGQGSKIGAVGSASWMRRESKGGAGVTRRGGKVKGGSKNLRGSGVGGSGGKGSGQRHGGGRVRATGGKSVPTSYGYPVGGKARRTLKGRKTKTALAPKVSRTSRGGKRKRR